MCCALLRYVCGFKTTQIIVQCCLIREFMIYEFERSHKADKTSKNICCTKGEHAFDHSTIIKHLKKIRSGHKNLDNKAKSGRSKTVDSEAVLQANETNSTSSPRRVSSELGI